MVKNTIIYANTINRGIVPFLMSFSKFMKLLNKDFK